MRLKKNKTSDLLPHSQTGLPRNPSASLIVSTTIVIKYISWIKWFNGKWREIQYIISQLPLTLWYQLNISLCCHSRNIYKIISIRWTWDSRQCSIHWLTRSDRAPSLSSVLVRRVKTDFLFTFWNSVELELGLDVLS